MDYSQGHAFSVGDGAGAAVMGVSDDFVMVDYAVQTRSEQYGAMTMRTRSPMDNKRRKILVDEQHIPIPTYEIQPEEGIQSFQSAMPGPAEMVKNLLAKHHLNGNDIALISHQASRLLIDYWQNELRPSEYLETLAQFGNMTLATYPVNLAYYSQRVKADYIVLVAVGVGYHQMAILLRNKKPRFRRYLRPFSALPQKIRNSGNML
jgi:3-oxoacyl-[acyl-carrier-protein] synthase-3